MLVNIFLVLVSISFIIVSTRKPLYPFYLLIIVSFFKGIIELLGISSTITNSIIQTLVLLFVLIVYLTCHENKRRFQLIGIRLFIIYSTIVLISAIVNNSNWFGSYSFYRHTLNAYLVFLGILNLKTKNDEIKKINGLIIILSILQIIASIAKYLIVGRLEHYIGTISVSAGTYSTIFPLIAITFLLSIYLLYKKKPIIFLFILGFLFMGWVGGKRGIFFFLPILMLFIFIYYNRIINRTIIKKIRRIPTIFLFVLLGFTIFYFGSRLSPSLNPENKFWGSFDLEYITDFIWEYNYRSQSDIDEYKGRGGGTRVIIQSLTNANNLGNQLFGYGPSRLINISRLEGAELFDFQYENITITGFSFYLLSIGILGTISIILFYYWFAKRIYIIAKLESNSYFKTLAFGTLITSIIFFIDFFTYSRAFIHSILFNLIYFYLAAISFKRMKYLTS